MSRSALPVLYSFRRCPYAMRARLAVQSAGITVELREILLRDKAPEFLAISPDGTVPLLQADGDVISESLEIMGWALSCQDPDGWLEMPQKGHRIIERFDGPFKAALDRTKYATRYPDSCPETEREKAMDILREIEGQLSPWLFGEQPRLADMAILPFVRQFAMIDKPRFDEEATPGVARWLKRPAINLRHIRQL